MASKKDPKAREPKHVTLSKETVTKLLQDPDPPKMISPWDLLELERTDFAVKIAAAALEQKKTEAAQRKFAIELANLQHDKEVAEALADLRAKIGTNQKLAANLASRYGFTWSTHSYNPDTGEILDTGAES